MSYCKKTIVYVIPAQAGIYNYLIILDPRLHGDDKTSRISTFYESIKMSYRKMSYRKKTTEAGKGPTSAVSVQL